MTDYERGREAAMNADMYEFDPKVCESILRVESEEFRNGWNSYFDGE